MVVNMRYLLIFGFLCGCSQAIEPVRAVPDFDHALVQYAKFAQHTGCDREQTEALIDAWCQYLEDNGHDVLDSKACLFLDQVPL